MTEELEDTFGEAAPTEEPPVEEVKEPEAPEENQEAPEPEVTVAETPPAETMVPLSVMLEERNKRQAAEQLANASKQPEPVAIPDVIDDQNGFVNSIKSQVQNATLNARLDVSEMMARENYGDDVVEAALQAAISSGKNKDFINGKHPYGEMVTWHQQAKAMEEIGDPTTFRERIKAELLKEIQSKQTQVVDEIKNPPSLAGETSIGGRTPPAAPSHTDLDDILA